MMKLDRRGILKAVAAGSVLATVSASVRAQDEKVVDFLFVQNAKTVSLKNGVLTLGGIAGDTLYFSDRPDRIAGRITTAEFVEKWTKGHDSFKADPPNAVLSVIHDSDAVDVVLVLRDPSLDGADLNYQVAVLDGAEMVEGAHASLFIDEIGRPLTPLSYAGMARRTSRRTARRVSRRNN
jgi:hypothetical protein